MAKNIKKGDMVEVITGEDKGTVAKVMRVITSKNKVIVESVNRRYKHVKPSRKYPQGGRIQIERPVHIRNVLPVSPKPSKGTRVKFVTGKKGEKKR
ncbi:MAG: 50S ribosomal protein L24, partial [Phycisphaerae bacterium]|nr:50S ribosomal protein L24 [Phycisphaerae bacterium]